MLSYFKGCTGSLISTILLFFILIHHPLAYIPLLGIITPFIFIGGILGYFLLRFLHAKNISNIWIGLLCFVFLGGLFALILQFFFPFPWQLVLITVVGSAFFFLTQLIKNVAISRAFAIAGPILSLILGFATRRM